MLLDASQITLLIATIAYLLGLSFSIYEIKIRKRLLVFVILGIVIGSIFVTAVVTLLIEITHYNTPLSPMSLFLFVPVVEELAKFLGVLFLWLLSSKKVLVNKYEIVRFGGGVGLGFGVFETFSYIALGASYHATTSRLLVSVPFHISSTMVVGFGLAERKSKTLLASSLIMAVTLHSLSNFLAIYNALLQGIVFWILLATLFFLSDRLYYTSSTN